jgi:hypothetical protein
VIADSPGLIAIRFAHIQLGAFLIMPGHLHGIYIIYDQGARRDDQAL